MPARYTLNDPDLPLNGRFLFDANIWLYINGPFAIHTDIKTVMYSRLFKAILNAKGSVCLSANVVSEVANRHLRQVYDIAKQNGFSDTFKAFRGSEEYKYAAQGLADDLYHLSNDVALIDYGFAAEKMDALFDELKKCEMDFGDVLILRVCQMHELILVTHDGDFSNADVDICSGNWKICV